MNKNIDQLYICFIGANDFRRRMSASVTQPSLDALSTEIKIIGASPAEARQVVFTERPDVVVLEIGHHTSRQDILWIRGLLEQTRDRYGRDIYIISAITSPEKLLFGGNLLFESESSLQPSGYIDNFLIAPPQRTPKVASIEAQLNNCLSYLIERKSNADEHNWNLPAMWDNGWVPAMCDPETRNVWMRWLPRYARYVNESPIIVGPTGSGKTRLAQAIHKLSQRTGPFISITPRDFSSSELVQAELFGAVAGAYTGAVDKWGLVKKAEKGTLFIDELQSIDRDLQGKLITFIENKAYRRVGEADSHHADVRFVFATNRPLQELVDDGSLRDDFAYRLERLQINLAPLSERRLDIAAGIAFALAKVLRERGRALSSATNQDGPTNNAIEGLTSEAFRSLFLGAWPGNLRQLENTVAKLIEFADIRQLALIDQKCVDDSILSLLGQKDVDATDIFESAARALATKAKTDGITSLSQFTLELSIEARQTALEYAKGDITVAAKLIQDSPKAMELFSLHRKEENIK